MPERKYFVICEDNCRFEGMTKTQIIETILAEVERRGTHKVNMNAPFSAKEINAGKEFSLWIGTQAEYNALSSTKENVLYIIAEDNAAKQSIIDDINDLNDDLESMSTDIESVKNGVAALKLAKDQQQTARQRIRENIADFTSRKNAMNDKITNDSVTAEAINSTLTRYKTIRETLTTLWTGSQSLASLVTLVCGTDLADDWDNFHELLFVVEVKGSGTLYAETLNMIYVPTEDVESEIILHKCQNARNDSAATTGETVKIVLIDAHQVPKYKAIEIKRHGSWTELTLKKIIGIGAR